jgi:Zn finger protein HypA/HybF involved in hydrogenase expression
MPTIWDISDKEFTKIIKESQFYKDVARKCGYNCLTNYRVIKKRINQLDLDTSHFLKFKVGDRKKKPLSEITVKNSTYHRGDLKKRLIKDLKWEYKCKECGQGDIWKGKKLTLELDHINGINNDHRLENLRFLCPNCHSTMPTNKGANVKRNKQNKKIYKCIDCKTTITKESTRCRSCASKKFNKKKVNNRPSLETLLKDLEILPYTKVGKKYGVSDNCIRKWIKGYNK